MMRLRSRLRGFVRDRSGVSAVEFALILPLMLLVYAGSVEISEALSVDRKVNQLASTVADLVAQRSTMNTTEMNNIFDATTAIMQPYPTTDVKILVAAVDIVSTTSQTVAWAETKSDIDPPNGSASPITVPPEVGTVGTQVIVARVQYNFVSPFSDFMSSITGKTSYSFEHVFMLRPRLGPTVNWN